MAAVKVTSAAADDEGSPTPGGKLKAKDYERELAGCMSKWSSCSSGSSTRA